ncbi:O-antigen ligase family protein [Larkinella punicea]|uniref:O-antigen ligase domain-containing protein n=1 Tax=Larkinella punicea TaxID=2315727 RepID=A0A368JQ54_9BACT|nr:O-antigen ligase family protein [Larkinella punicea]RCR69799.1 O-antigen ligase domain-containing protein [Larkinella punicea]
MGNQTASLSYAIQKNFWLFSLLGTLIAVASGFLIARLGILGSAVIIILPLGLLLVGGVLAEPKFGFLVYVQLSFLVNALARFLPVSIPFGMIIDGILGLTVLSLIVNNRRLSWKRLHHPAFYLVGIWFFYTVLEIFNPESPYRAAWFFHARSFSLHFFIVTCTILVVDLTRADILLILRTWLVWSFLAALWAFKQQYIGLTTNEMIWLNSGAASTHILFGHLRSFSFYTDASQFGAEMAAVSLLCFIWSFEAETWPRKLGYLFLLLVYFWGYAVSGTRSALFVLIAGYGFYLFMKRDLVKIAIGICVAAPLLFVLKYTNAGSGNYQIQRMRTALNPLEDPSFLLRLKNQQKLANYLKDLPFGAGIGTSLDTGQRFSPNHWAAQISPDSWYVELWIETGRVGMILYITMLIALISIGVYRVWHLKDPWLTSTMRGLVAVFVGIAVMGYSNPVLGQFPTSSMLFINALLFTTCNRWDKR